MTPTELIEAILGIERILLLHELEGTGDGEAIRRLRKRNEALRAELRERREGTALTA